VAELIPFNVPYVPEISKKYVLESLESNHQQGDGPFTARASKMVSDLAGGGHVLLTPSCTHALEMASMLANIGPGDEVILPSYTFTSAATAITKFGATPVFVDIELKTKGIDVNQVRESITPRTKAISWVNYAGVAPDIEGLKSLAQEFDLLLIEDNAHGLGGSYKGEPLGSFGDFATQSFHATKNIQCGEGGALVINNPEFIERAEIIREKGTNRAKFIRGDVQKYQWVDQGSSYLLAEVLAAQLTGALENFNVIQSARVELFDSYKRITHLIPNLLDSSQDFNKSEQNVAHMFYIQLETTLQREALRKYLLEHQVNTYFHYQPLNASQMGLKTSRTLRECQISVNFAETILRFPIWVGLENSKILKLLEDWQNTQPLS
jgi:dTDP-4-amino-4,6-dideoxygalactose transaminase